MAQVFIDSSGIKTKYIVYIDGVIVLNVTMSWERVVTFMIARSIYKFECIME